MTRSTSQPRGSDFLTRLSRAAGDSLSLRTMLDLVAQQLGATNAMLVALMPRGTPRIVESLSADEAILRAYARDLHAADHLSWQTVIENRAVQAVAGDEPAAAAADGDGYLGWLSARAGLVNAAVAPVASPLLAGFPGALHVYRTSAGEPFDADDLAALTETANAIAESLAAHRERRASGAAASADPEPLGTRLFLFDQTGRSVPIVDQVPLDDRMQTEMSRAARARLAAASSTRDEGPESLVVGERVPLPREDGELIPFRAVTYRQLPAVGDGPFVGFVLMPTSEQWAALRGGDLPADPETGRLVATMTFMHDNFRRSPTLVDIAKVAHLSPFHFHRRFTDLIGLTPKHFLLDCQTVAAKADLLAGTKELATIARECGFAHQSHFTSRFKQAVGLTPTRWRRIALDRRRR